MNCNPNKVAGYLYTLYPPACDLYCDQNLLDKYSILPLSLDTVEAVEDCIYLFEECGLPLEFLFYNQEVWGNYLKLITEPRYHAAIEMVLATQNPAELLSYFRACYRFGFPALDDPTSDKIERLYIETFPSLSFFLDQTYDDEEYSLIVTEAIKMSSVKVSKSGKTNYISSDALNSAEYAEMNTKKSTTIRPVISPEEAFEFWKNAPTCDVHFSLKIDGVNTKALFNEDGSGLKLAISRGRSADSIDYTDALNAMFKVKGIDTSKLHGLVTGESEVRPADLKKIVSRYPDRDYKTSKSTAMAMLRAPGSFLEEDFQYLTFSPFSCEDLRVDLAFAALEEAGLKTPPHMVVKGTDIPKTSVEEFDEWLTKNVLDMLWMQACQHGISSDGVVMYLIGDVFTERKDVYSDANIAIKYGYWASAEYTGTVDSIIVEQQRTTASIVLQIAPVVMRDGNTATRVGIGSPDILMRDNVRVGDKILFTRKSEAYDVYLKKL